MSGSLGGRLRIAQMQAACTDEARREALMDETKEGLRSRGEKCRSPVWEVQSWEGGKSRDRGKTHRKEVVAESERAGAHGSCGLSRV